MIARHSYLFRLENNRICLVLKIPRQCSLVYPAKVGFRQSEAFGSRVGKVIGSGLLCGYQQKRLPGRKYCVFVTFDQHVAAA
jgi:hypothetical protein